MVKTTLRVQREDCLRIPYEIAAPVQTLTLAGKNGATRTFETKLSAGRVDLWMEYPAEAFWDSELTVTAQSGWVDAIRPAAATGRQKRREALRPDIHYAPATGSFKDLLALAPTAEGGWACTLAADNATPLALNDTGAHRVHSSDLLHWRPGSGAETSMPDASAPSSHWLGDVQAERSCPAEQGGYVLALSCCAEHPDCAAGNLLSLPAAFRDGRLEPLPQVNNLRVWERLWRGQPLERVARFEMRFHLAPANWPDIRVLDKLNTEDDIRTRACEVVLELLVGQEPEVEIDLCGQVWRWEALTQTLHCRGYSLRVQPTGGRLCLHFYSDMMVQELFAGTEQAMLVTLPEGPAQGLYRIQSELVENINNPSFAFPYYADPYLQISTPGATASLVELKVYGLRSTSFSAENRERLQDAEPGRALFQGQNYTVYEHCVKDRIYGEPPAWAVDGGDTVLSPVRAVEEFCWRNTPWGDMTRIVNRSEKWTAPARSRYPVLHSETPVLKAAYGLAADIMEQNRNERFALPGQQGLMNAALFQGPGEGFGIWVRDACHAAFRLQNIAAPQEARESLVYVSERGFNNGEDCAAMPALAIWDHYVATGDTSILYETLPGVLRYAAEADGRFVPQKGLVSANMCLAQDAFEEPENGGYCLGTEILFACMYQAVAQICETLDVEPEKRRLWARRGADMVETIRREFWNEEAGVFTSGPRGSEAYEKGWWEATGAEMALWPRFGIAAPSQRDRFLSAIQANPKALSDFGINWYPFREEKNHFWKACWVSWTLGIATAAAEAGDAHLLRTLIFQQVRNVLLNKTFHEVMDNETGRAWRWPGLPWHAAGFLGFFLYGVFGLRYGLDGLRFYPCVPEGFAGMKLTGLRYREAEFCIEIHEEGVGLPLRMDGSPLEGAIPPDAKGLHLIEIGVEPGDAGSA